MASTVLSGSSNVSYTNNTGQNVRVVVNYMAAALGSPPTISMAFGPSGSATATAQAIGRNLAFSAGFVERPGFGIAATLSANNMCVADGLEYTNNALPTEVMLAAGQSFSATCGPYNIVVIPEA